MVIQFIMLNADANSTTNYLTLV